MIANAFNVIIEALVTYTTVIYCLKVIRLVILLLNVSEITRIDVFYLAKVIVIMGHIPFIDAYQKLKLGS